MLPFHVESNNGIEFRLENSGQQHSAIHKLGKKADSINGLHQTWTERETV
jgi:hypothetical protein